MKTHVFKRVCAALAALLLGTSATSFAEAGKVSAPKVPLTEAGKKLETLYSNQLKALKDEIIKALPATREGQITTYRKACEAETAAEAQVAKAKKAMEPLGRGAALVAHAKGKWIGGAEKGIAETKAKLKKAKTEAERQALLKELAKWEKNKQDGLDALKERQAAYDAAKRQEPTWTKNLEAAEKALAEAKANTLKALDALHLNAFLASDKLDPKLVEYVVLYEGTPYGLAAFAQQGNQQEARIASLLKNVDLMMQMCIADGPVDGKYGQAMDIYAAIQKASEKADSGVLQRLALAISLEHATPIGQRNAKADTTAAKTVDPVKRYLSYEQAYLNGELDTGFKNLSVRDLRMVVDGEEPDSISAWGREMLRDYRPDHIFTSDYRWRYVSTVRTEVRYGSQYNKYDKPELQFFQNILMNGGVCGRRAFFGRFILRAFGIPTTARPQPGHAALAHWTPKGWVVCLGAGWGSGWTKGRYHSDLDFLANTQAREDKEGFLRVKRAQWVGDVLGEKRVFGLHDRADPDFWYGISLYEQQEVINKAKAVTLAAVGEELGEANETEVKAPVGDDSKESNERITVTKDGVITIPAANCSKPTKSTGKIIFMKSFDGGSQLHYSRIGSPQSFEYTVNAPKAGTYMLGATIANPSWGQNLLVAVNGAKEPTEITLPLTVGLWDTITPVAVTLAKGENVLTFSRSGDNIRGLSIKYFTLTPSAK